MSRVFVVSDLHLFAKRSHAPREQELLDEARSAADRFVLNGDIVDFKWSTLSSLEETVEAGLRWVERIHDLAPTRPLHYVLGNHDALQAYAEGLDALQVRLPSFTWSPTHLRLGDTLFTHGDLKVSRGTGACPTRRLEQSVKQQHRVLHASHESIVALRLHQSVRVTHGPRQSIRRVRRFVVALPAAEREGLSQVCFGHTHVPFRDVLVDGIRYFNTGSAVKGLPFRPLELRIGGLD